MYKIGIIGSTGAVGKEIIKTLFNRKFPIEILKLFTSEKSAGKLQNTPYGDIKCELFTIEKAKEMDIIIMAVSGEFSLKYAKEICKNNGPIVIDNSSAWRYDSDIPLIIPEINAQVLTKENKLIANPNCTTAIASVVLFPIHKKYHIKKLFVSSYQATSGAGNEGIDELKNTTLQTLTNQPISENKVFSNPIAFNVIPHIDKFLENGYTKEEMKIVWETKKIFNDDTIDISCTAVRVPTIRAHAETLIMECENKIDINDVKTLLSNSPGVKLVDEPEKNIYPMPITASDNYDVEVGRIRKNLIFGDFGLELFVCGDQLLKGAALNAVQIAELYTKL